MLGILPIFIAICSSINIPVINYDISNCLLIFIYVLLVLYFHLSIFMLFHTFLLH